MIPKDPFMLLSWINMQLRDYYSSLDELCKAFQLDRRSIEAALGGIDFTYNPDTNSFI